MKIQVDLPEEINRSLKVHKLKWKFENLQEAIIDSLKRFFSQDDFNYFEKLNTEGIEKKGNIRKKAKFEDG